ncbi:hypothetical protein BDW02DRAFT_521639 [Decorospora gaudefroyi]|uniref:BTB domain-containing protein n=1 Tax=Decorospora gaudefroyi TaxID=184978 RepID=A0A6A5KGG7_9PLEO|nr:hypothetical protein BDW02DRAFT_521639 [Decorospora gaudefroyi]
MEDDLSFLNTSTERGQSNATLRIVLPSDEVCHISDHISPFRFLDRCPLLYHAFEYGTQTRLQASIEAPSKYAVVSLLRYCYTGSYLPVDAGHGPILLLPHAQTYKISEDFQVPKLQLLAHGNFLSQIELACCMPTPPQDLLDSIQFVYRYYSSRQARQQHGLVDTLLNYCISMFHYHKLGENLDFLKVATDISEFRQDLCRMNMERRFQDECANDIVRLCLDTVQLQACVRPTTLASRDLPQEMICDDPPATTNELESDATIGAVAHLDEKICERADQVEPVTATLVLRSKISQLGPAAEIELESSDEERGFSTIRRPKVCGRSNPFEPMSSPELVATPLFDFSDATKGDDSDNEEWTKL